MGFGIWSPSFAPGGEIPARYTCDGENLSPPLKWSAIPRGAKSLALIVNDPDAPAGDWVHWVLYGIPPTRTELPEGVPPRDLVRDIGVQGINDFRRVGWGGPCPPPGPAHRYVFRIHALDVELRLKPRASRADLLRAIGKHLIGRGESLAYYKRK